MDYSGVYQNYHTLPKISFDYKVVENTQNIIAIPYQGIWSDLGTWDVISQHLEKPILGPGFLSADCQNTHVINTLDIPIMGLGLEDTIIAAGPQGILVSNKSSSGQLKEHLKISSIGDF
jgi:mannose-1-phosphate guanylyltransferase